MRHSWLRKHGLKLAIWILLVLPLGSFLIVSAAIAAYLYWPRSYEQINYPAAIEAWHLLLLVHGVKDEPSTWAAPLQEELQPLNEAQVLAIDWSVYAQNSLSCAINGKRIGERLGRALLVAEGGPPQSLHLVGHSCGAFVIYGVCHALQQAEANILLHNTYLDPVSVHGVRWQYGLENFGRCADYSDAYIDTADDVPGSNQPLPHAYTYDLSDARKRSGSDVAPHLWPVLYYRQLLLDEKAPQYRLDPTLPERKPAGEWERL